MVVVQSADKFLRWEGDLPREISGLGVTRIERERGEFVEEEARAVSVAIVSRPTSQRSELSRFACGGSETA